MQGIGNSSQILLPIPISPSLLKWAGLLMLLLGLSLTPYWNWPSLPTLYGDRISLRGPSGIFDNLMYILHILFYISIYRLMVIRRMEDRSTSRISNPWIITGIVIGLNILATSLPFSCYQLRSPIRLAALLVPAITMTYGKWKRYKQVKTCGSLLILLALMQTANMFENDKWYNFKGFLSFYQENSHWISSVSTFIVQGGVVYLTNKLLIIYRQDKGEPAFREWPPLIIPKWLILTLLCFVAAGIIIGVILLKSSIPFFSIYDNFAFLTVVNWNWFLQLLFFLSLSFTLAIRLKLSDGTEIFPSLSPITCLVVLLAANSLTAGFPFFPSMLTQSFWTPDYYIINVIVLIVSFLPSFLILVVYSTGKWADIPMIRNTRNFFIVCIIMQIFMICSTEMMFPTYLWYISLVIFTLCVILILFSNNKAIRALKGSYNRQP